jgi:hypothetical protein
MTTEQAINTLIKAVEVAQTKGAYTLADANAILEAIKALGAKPETKEEPEEVKE